MIALAAGDYRLEVDPARGGAVVRFDWRGRPLLRPTCGPSILDTACFPLVPFSNRIADGTFEADGRTVRIPPNFPGADHPHPLHGFGWLAEWEVADVDTARIELRHDHPGGAWPWPYRATQRLELDADGLTMTLTVENRGAGRMPAGLGFHPYFPRDPDTTYLGLHRGEWRNDADCLPRALHEAREPIDWWGGRPVGSRAVDTVYTDRRGPLEIRWPSRGLALTLAPSPELPFTVVYTPADAGFFCVEPVSHATDAVRCGDGTGGMRRLASGEGATASLRLRATAT